MKKEMSNRQIWLFCLGEFSRAVIGGLIITFLIKFFMPVAPSDANRIPNIMYMFDDATTFGAILPFAGISIAVIRGIGLIFDAITDPWIANMSDRFKHKKGRRIPFMRLGAIPYAVFCVLIFFPPIVGGNLANAAWINIVWVGLLLLLYYLFSTIYFVPYMAMQQELTSDTKRRVYLYTISSLMFVLGSLVIYLAPMLTGLLMQGGMDQMAAYQLSFTIFGLVGLVTAILPAFCINENEFVEQKNYSQPILKSLKETFKYKNFRIMTLGYLAMQVGFAFFNAALLYYVTTLIGLEESWGTIILGISIVVGVSLYPLLNKLVAKIGKKPMLIGACIAYFVVYMLMYIISFVSEMPELLRQILGIFVGICISFPIAITNIVPPSAFADLAQYDSIKTGDNKTGMFVAARNFMNKLSQAIVMFIVPAVLIGWNNITNPNATPTKGGVALTALFAAAAIVISLVLYSMYDDKHVVGVIDAFNAEQKIKREEAQNSNVANTEPESKV